MDARQLVPRVRFPGLYLKTMKATELRIGNIVGRELARFPHNYFTVLEVAEMNAKFSEGVRMQGINHGSQFWDPTDMEGIPLTEDWLKQLGFDYKSKTTGGYEWSILNGVKLLDRKLYCGDGTFSKPIEYVHQLQNLYYALIGEELILRP